jgi:hypothetical protein
VHGGQMATPADTIMLCSLPVRMLIPAEIVAMTLKLLPTTFTR